MSPPTDADILARLTPVQVVALTLWGEARGSTPALRRAIAAVILNRARARQQTPEAVCLASMQFSCWTPKGGAANHAAVIAAARALLEHATPIGPVLKGCLALAGDVNVGVLVDTVGGATHYYSPPAMVPKGRVPSWAHGLEPVAVIDGTRFFAGVK